MPLPQDTKDVVLSLLGVGGLATIFTLILRFLSTRRKYEDQFAQAEFVRLTKRIESLETDRDTYLRRNVELQSELLVVHKELSQLRATVARLEAEAVVASVVCDSEGRITEWSSGATRLFGWSALESVGQSISMLVPKRLQEQHMSAFRSALAVQQGTHPDQAARIRESDAVLKNGGEIPVIITLVSWRHGHDIFFSAEIRRR